ncbi:hypothetical protein [Scytonema sp. NUACC21]
MNNNLLIPQKLEQNRRLHLKRLEAYKDIEQSRFAHPEELSYSELCRYMVLKMGICYDQAWNSWCEESIELLQNLKE